MKLKTVMLASSLLLFAPSLPAAPLCEGIFNPNLRQVQDSLNQGHSVFAYIPSTSKLSRGLSQKLSQVGELRGELASSNTGVELEVPNPFLTAQKNSPLKSFVGDVLRRVLAKFRPTLYLGKTQYQIRVQELRISTDEDLAQKLMAQENMQQGVVFQIEAELSEANLLNQDSQIGLFGNPATGIKSGELRVSSKAPLSVRVPLFAGLDHEGQLKLRILDISGLQESQLQIESRGLELPSLQLKIGGHAIDFLSPIQRDSLQAEINQISNNPYFLKQIQGSLVAFLNQALAKLIETPLQKDLGQQLSVQVKPQQIEAKGDAVGVGFRVKIGSKGTLQSDDSKPSSRGRACEISCAPYDIALGVNSSLLNEVSAAVFKQGLLANLPVQGGRLTVLEIPTLEYVQTSANSVNGAADIKARLRIRPEDMHILQGFVARDDFSVQIQATLRISPNAKGNGVTVSIIKIEEDGILFEEENLRFLPRFLAGLPLPGMNLAKRLGSDLILGSINRMILENQIAPIEISLPAQLSGLADHVKIRSLAFDENRHLYILLAQE